MRRARELDPLDPMMHAMSSQVAFQAGDYPAALEHARQATDLDPEFWIGYVMSGQALIQFGQPAGALDALTTAGRFSDCNSKTMSFRGHVLGNRGERRTRAKCSRHSRPPHVTGTSRRTRWHSSPWGWATRTRRSSGSSAPWPSTTST